MKTLSHFISYLHRTINRVPTPNMDNFNILKTKSKNVHVQTDTQREKERHWRKIKSIWSWFKSSSGESTSSTQDPSERQPNGYKQMNRKCVNELLKSDHHKEINGMTWRCRNKQQKLKKKIQEWKQQQKLIVRRHLTIMWQRLNGI